ncbi:hypothetical protein VaNZ11_000569 [Volvox africanus]|uniref:RING-CH-type domain-containing protein n=1 Tax=Volvox africanus TaxID=51714 RepID=A0ABQ5RMK3_9CHLO|nr:hypothetical protein VaNZ11_000569 [Volvox africanus]
MSSSTSVSLQAAAGPAIFERDPLLGKEDNEVSQSEHMLRTNRGCNTPVATNTCRICMDEEVDPILNPLISPCKCSGSTKYVHRQCLLKWRSMKSGTQAYYRCEICHYRYQFRRLWWAQVLGHPITSILIFSALLTSSAWLLGYVPLMELLVGVPPGSHIGLHFLNGFLLVGLLGALALLIQLCVTLPGSLPPGACNGCYCEPCPMVAIAGGEECLALLLVLLVSMAIAGLVWVCKTLYGTLYGTLRERMRWAEHMVENVGEVGGKGSGRDGPAESSRGLAGVARWRFRFWGSSAGSSGAPSSSAASAVSAESPASGGPSGSSPVGGSVATKAPAEESMV